MLVFSLVGVRMNEFEVSFNDALVMLSVTSLLIELNEFSTCELAGEWAITLIVIAIWMRSNQAQRIQLWIIDLYGGKTEENIH